MKKKTLAQSSQKNKLGIGLAVFCALYILSLFVDYINGYTLYPLYLVKCGKQPIAVLRFAGGHSYRLPGDDKYTIDGLRSYF